MQFRPIVFNFDKLCILTLPCYAVHARTFTPRFTYEASHLTTCDGFITLGSLPVGSISMQQSSPNGCNPSLQLRIYRSL